MTRAVRERPRVALASALTAVAGIAAAIAVGAVLLGGESSVSARTQARLERAEGLAAERGRALQSRAAELEQVGGELRAVRARARTNVRTSARLRRDMRQLQRALASAQRKP